MKISYFIGLAIFMTPLICNSDEASAGTYRNSWEFEREILYISQNFAITRDVRVKQGRPASIFYTLRKTKYDGFPEFSEHTGDDIGDMLVDHIQEMSWSKEKQIFFGKGIHFVNKKLNDRYFIFDGKNGKNIFFEDKKIFGKHLGALGIEKREMLDIELQFRIFIRDISRSAQHKQ